MSEEKIPIYRKPKEESHQDSPLTLINKKDWKRGDGVLSTKFPAVFPELPGPLKRIYVGVKDLNEGDKSPAAMTVSELGLDRRPKPAIVAGMKFDF